MTWHQEVGDETPPRTQSVRCWSDAATACVDRVGMAHLPSGRSHLVPASQSLEEQLADAFEAAIANAKLFQMRDRLEEILRQRAKRSLRSRYVLDSLVLINAGRVLVTLSIDRQGKGWGGPLGGGGGPPSAMVGAGKPPAPPPQQELSALLPLSEAECDPARRASSIQGEHQSGALRCAAPKPQPQTEPSM